jgi:hypothetical protein
LEEVAAILKIGSCGFSSCHVVYISCLKRYSSKLRKTIIYLIIHLNGFVHIITMGWLTAWKYSIIFQFITCDCFKGEDCIRSDNEATASAKNKIKESKAVTDREKSSEKLAVSSSCHNSMQLNPSPTKHCATLFFHKLRIYLSQAVTITVPLHENDNNMVTGASEKI